LFDYHPNPIKKRPVIKTIFSMVFIGAFIVPHGAIILDPSIHYNTEKLSKEENERCKLLNESMRQNFCEQVAELKPDIILLSTPHGICLENDFGFYLNKSASGTAEWLNEYKEFQVNVTLANEETKHLLDELRNHHSVQGINAFSVSEPIPLRWGEVVPLWFLRDLSSIRYIIMTQPIRRYAKAKEMTQELQQMGKLIYNFCQNHESVRSKRVLLVVSGDLAHTHSIDDPYGFSPCAQPFDNFISQWIETRDSSVLIEKALDILSDAKSCGYSGLVILDGIIHSCMEKSIACQVYVNEHPTYYGMIVAQIRIN
jgi:aromatic ring-opening dioxygenase LigB subunit